jgi:hypothetical protein
MGSPPNIKSFGLRKEELELEKYLHNLWLLVLPHAFNKEAL